MKKLVLTGAAGRLASHLRELLLKFCDELDSSDIVDSIGTDAPHRPDIFYGLTKCFAEDLASPY